MFWVCSLLPSSKSYIHKIPFSGFTLVIFFFFLSFFLLFCTKTHFCHTYISKLLYLSYFICTYNIARYRQTHHIYTGQKDTSTRTRTITTDYRGWEDGGLETEQHQHRVLGVVAAEVAPAVRYKLFYTHSALLGLACLLLLLTH